jgi:hypothetical protein
MRETWFEAFLMMRWFASGGDPERCERQAVIKKAPDDVGALSLM